MIRSIDSIGIEWSSADSSSAVFLIPVSSICTLPFASFSPPFFLLIAGESHLVENRGYSGTGFVNIYAHGGTSDLIYLCDRTAVIAALQLVCFFFFTLVLQIGLLLLFTIVTIVSTAVY